MNALPPEEDPPSLRALQAAYEALLQEQEQLQLRVKKLEHNARKKAPLFSASRPLATTPKPTSPSKVYAWEQLLGVQGFAWLGVFAFLSGAGLFIRYAYLEGWLGPWSVLLSGCLLGAGLLAGGNTIALRYSRYQSWAHALMGAGIALFYFLAYASYHFEYFQQVTHLNAFGDAILLMVIVAFAIALSVYRKSQTLASRAFIMGFFTSVLSTSFSGLTLFYNLFLSLGLLGVVFKTRWHILLRMGVLGSWILQGVWSYSNPGLTWGTHSILLLYTVLYGVAGLWLSHTHDRPSAPEVLTGMVNIGGYLGVFSLLYYQDAPYLWWVHSLYTLIALGLIYGAQRQHKLSAAYHGLLGVSLPIGFYLCLINSSDRLQGLFLSLTALILYGCARFLQQQKTGPVVLWQLYDSLSASCLLGAVYLLTYTPYTALCLIGLSLFFLWHTRLPLAWQHWQAENTNHYWGIAWVFHINCILVLYIKHYERLSSWRDGILTLLLFSGFLWRKPLMKVALQHGWLWPNSLAIILYSYALLPVDSLTATWAILGALFVVSGFWLRETVVRYQGLAILACAGLKLLISDLQYLSMGLRIISLFVIGSVLMALAWVYIRYEEHVKEHA
jgi:uncharacterized membrane protein